ncbi:TPA: fimbrial protein [Enterobacter asburiae]|uniref:fimbrial protein n=1 Tax=Enterobacter asburiae TaxID=61645 RepID=UPI000756AD5F|nr:fimbrial protein [Enterobacter asburiae]SAF06544.1 fimbrial protein domain-containing protein [Enterobacter cloacae]KVJ82420.1 MrfF [Enterobacter asburiae]MDL4615213.1 fimbrial protein [Enterobacter asburiae]HCM9126669.1 fimbrial protein [Enterobacter asburiae]HCM9130627.1 fimbrial protein [Enterobacter asburiae]
MKLFRLAAIVLIFGAISHSSVADDNNINITVKVVVRASPCKINNGQVIDVNFGDTVITTDVPKQLVEKDVNYTLDCASADQSKTLVMRISGTGATFDDKSLKTSIPELGIKMKADGADYPVNTDLVLANSSSKPALKALLVQESGAHLPTGSFTAGATMTVDYQ